MQKKLLKHWKMVYVSGLYLEGAAWDLEDNCLRLQDPKVLVVDLPLLMVEPKEANRVKLINVFETPVYVTRTEEMQWVSAGSLMLI